MKYLFRNKYGWGSNPYYLAGQFSIHPTYIQSMQIFKIKLSEILASIENLKKEWKSF